MNSIKIPNLDLSKGPLFWKLVKIPAGGLLRDLQSPSVISYFRAFFRVFDCSWRRSLQSDKKYEITLGLWRSLKRPPAGILTSFQNKGPLERFKLGILVEFMPCRPLRASPDPPFPDPNFTPYYSTVNGGILRVDLHCQKLQNSMNSMVILKYPICHWEYLKSMVKVAVYLDRAVFEG